MEQEIKNLVIRILSENSGGVKFNELMVEYVSYCCENKINPMNPDELLQQIKEIEGIGVLEYVYKEIQRLKYFVYNE